MNAENPTTVPFQITAIPIDQLHPNPANSNVMSPTAFRKLVAHIQRSDRYPPVIVRTLPRRASEDTDGLPRYQILDGHHRVKAIRQLGHAQAQCLIWDVDDCESLLLLATLNRLQGQDDPEKRASLIAELTARHGVELQHLAEQLPENLKQLNKLLKLCQPPPSPVRPQDLNQMPVAVHFFLLPEERNRLEDALKSVGGTREQALMRIVTGSSGESTDC